MLPANNGGGGVSDGEVVAGDLVVFDASGSGSGSFNAPFAASPFRWRRNSCHLLI
jgi:hypothetical protein